MFTMDDFGNCISTAWESLDGNTSVFVWGTTHTGAAATQAMNAAMAFITDGLDA